MKHSVADRVSQQFSEFMSNRPHHHTFFCGLTRFCPHCCCSSINSSDSVLPLDGPKVEILFLKTFQLINVCTYVYYIYPIDVDLQERLLDSIVMLAVSKMGTLSNSLATNAVVDMYNQAFAPLLSFTTVENVRDHPDKGHALSKTRRQWIPAQWDSYKQSNF